MLQPELLLPEDLSLGSSTISEQGTVPRKKVSQSKRSTGPAKIDFGVAFRSNLVVNKVVATNSYLMLISFDV